MILIFDYFETLLNTKSMDFNRCLYEFWKDYYQDKCPFEAMKKYGEDLFQVLMEKHKNGEEYPFVKEELPLYAQKFGGDKVDMNAEEEADFLMQCNEFELAIDTALEENPEEIRENIVFIGDIYETDVVGAHQAGIKSAWLNKKDRSDENGWATYNCTSASQLSKILEGEYEY